jgi:hypothetical protein
VTGFLKRRVVPFLPIVLLLALTSVGLANALQSEEEEGPDLGPQLADYNDDVTGYLVGAAEYRTAPDVAVSTDGEPTVVQFTVTGCAEGSSIKISFVPRILPAEEAAANAALADDDPTKLAQEPIVLVEEAEALADGSAYELTMPQNVPLGFARLRVECVDADGNEVTSDTVLNIVEQEAFEAEQADAEEPEELVTEITAKPAVAPPAPADTADQAEG